MLKDELKDINTEMVCNRCGREIDLLEDFVKFLEYSQGIQKGKRHYHKKCFIEKFKIIKKNQIRKGLKDIIPMIKEEIYGA